MGSDEIMRAMLGTDCHASKDGSGIPPGTANNEDTSVSRTSVSRASRSSASKPPVSTVESMHDNSAEISDVTSNTSRVKELPPDFFPQKIADIEQYNYLVSRWKYITCFDLESVSPIGIEAPDLVIVDKIKEAANWRVLEAFKRAVQKYIDAMKTKIRDSIAILVRSTCLTKFHIEIQCIQDLNKMLRRLREQYPAWSDENGVNEHNLQILLMAHKLFYKKKVSWMKKVHEQLESEFRLKLKKDNTGRTILDQLLKQLSDQHSRNWRDHTKSMGGYQYLDTKSSEKELFGQNVQFAFKEVTTVVMGEPFKGYIYHTVAQMMSAPAPEVIEVANQLGQLVDAGHDRSSFFKEGIALLNNFYDQKINALPSSAAANNTFGQAMSQSAAQHSSDSASANNAIKAVNRPRLSDSSSSKAAKTETHLTAAANKNAGRTLKVNMLETPNGYKANGSTLKSKGEEESDSKSDEVDERKKNKKRAKAKKAKLAKMRRIQREKEEEKRNKRLDSDESDDSDEFSDSDEVNEQKQGRENNRKNPSEIDKFFNDSDSSLGGSQESKDSDSSSGGSLEYETNLSAKKKKTEEERKAKEAIEMEEYKKLKKSYNEKKAEDKKKRDASKKDKTEASNKPKAGASKKKSKGAELNDKTGASKKKRQAAVKNKDKMSLKGAPKGKLDEENEKDSNVSDGGSVIGVRTDPPTIRKLLMYYDLNRKELRFNASWFGYCEKENTDEGIENLEEHHLADDDTDYAQSIRKYIFCLFSLPPCLLIHCVFPNKSGDMMTKQFQDGLANQVKVIKTVKKGKETKKEEVECKEGSIYWKMVRDAIRDAEDRLQGEENEESPVKEPSAYEKLREKNIEKNDKKLASCI